MDDLYHFDAALAGQPAHGALDRVVLQVAEQHLVARLQAVVVADQRLQGVGGTAGQGHSVFRRLQQRRQLAADVQRVDLLEALAHQQRVAAVHPLDVVLVLLGHAAGHAPEVAVFQVDRPRLDVELASDALPMIFVVGKCGCSPWHGGLFFSDGVWVCRVWPAGDRAGR